MKEKKGIRKIRKPSFSWSKTLEFGQEFVVDLNGLHDGIILKRLFLLDEIVLNGSLLGCGKNFLPVDCAVAKLRRTSTLPSVVGAPGLMSFTWNSS